MAYLSLSFQNIVTVGLIVFMGNIILRLAEIPLGVDLNQDDIVETPDSMDTFGEIITGKSFSSDKRRKK